MLSMAQVEQRVRRNHHIDILEIIKGLVIFSNLVNISYALNLDQYFISVFLSPGILSILV